MEQAYKHTDIFLTHTWRPDLHGRNNHDRVRLINQRLNQLGFTSWFDEVKMEGEIKAKMAEGLDHTRCVIVFVTEEYMRKIDSEGQDNCKFEFDRAITQKTKTHILCVVMEEKYNNPANWFGKFKKELGNCLFVSMCGSLNDEMYLKRQLDLIVDQLKSKGVIPSQMKKKCQDCMQVGKGGDRQALFLDGDYCTYCACSLLRTTEAKNYCSKCNHHQNGIYCSSCKSHLLDKETIIAEHSQQFIKMLALESNVELSRFNTAEVEQTIEHFRQELEELNTKRMEAKGKGDEVRLSDSEFGTKMGTLEENLGAVIQNTSSLAVSAEEGSLVLEPAYEEELRTLQEMLLSLTEKRSKINQRKSDVSRAADDLTSLGKQLLDMKKEVMQEKDQFLHNKSCLCEDCAFERHLISQMISEGPKYLKTLVKENRIGDVKSVIRVKKEILSLKDDDGFNLLLSAAIEHGSLDMCKMIFDAGVQIGSDIIFNETLLHKVKDVDKIDLLCEWYGDKLLTARDENGNTPLMSAYMSNNIPLVEVLRKHAKLPEEKILMHQFDQLDSKGFEHIRELIRNNDIAVMSKLLTFKKDIVHMKDHENNTPFLCCSMEGSLPMLKLLVEYGSDTAARNMQDRTALILAVGHNDKQCEEIVKWLCKHHIHLLTVEDNNGKNVLHHAVVYNKPAVLSILLQYTPPMMILKMKDKHNDNLLNLAKKMKYDKIVDMFKGYSK